MWDGIERRRGADLWTKLINGLNAICWLGFVVALAIFHYARPEMNNIILQYHGIQVREYWVASLRYWMLLSLYVSVGLSLATLIINRYRMKRRSDRKRYNIIVLIVVIAGFLGIISFG